MESAGSSPRSFAALVQQVKRTRSGGGLGGAISARSTPPIVASSSAGAYPQQISYGSHHDYVAVGITPPPPIPPHLMAATTSGAGGGRVVGNLAPFSPPYPGENITEATSIMTPMGSGSFAGTDPYADYGDNGGNIGGTPPRPIYPPFVSGPSPAQHHRSPLAPYVNMDEESETHTPPTPSPAPPGGNLNLGVPYMQQLGLGIGMEPVSPLPMTPHAPVFDSSSTDSRPTQIEDNGGGSRGGTFDDNSPGNAKLRDNALYDASLAGVLEDVKVLLNNGANPSARGGFYNNPLQAAAHLGRTEIVVALLRSGAEVNAKGGHYGTAMTAAAFGEHLETVKVLCAWAADPNVLVEYYGNALTAACSTGNEDIASILLRYGSDVNAVGGFYGTALQAAARYGSKELVEALLVRGADVGVVAGHFGNALRAAAFNENHNDVVQLLIRHGAGNYPRMRSRSVQVDTGLGVGGHVGDALVLAAMKGQIVQLQELLSQGADANAKGSATSSFANALQAASFGGFCDVVELLLSHGANINSMNGHLGTPLQAAVCSLYENENVVGLLIRHGADVNLKCGYFGTPLIAAAYFGHIATIRLLVQSGADLDANGGTYASPVDAARAALNREVEALLVHLGARDPDRDEQRESDPNGMISYMVARKDVPKPREPSEDYTTAAALAQVYKIQAAPPAPGEVKTNLMNYPAAAAALAQHEARMYRSQSSSLNASPRVSQHGQSPMLAQGQSPRLSQGASPRLSQGASPRLSQGAPPRAPQVQGTTPPTRNSLLQVPGAAVVEAEEVEEEEDDEQYGISPVPSNIAQMPASYTPVSNPPDDVRRYSERRSSRPTPTPSAHLEPTTVYSVTSTGVALEELIATDDNWEEILELLPDDLQSGLSFNINLGNPVWTSLSSTHVNPLPLFIANAPVITPLLPIAPSATISIPPPTPSKAQAPAMTFDDILPDSQQQPQQPIAKPPPPSGVVIPDPLPFQLDPSKPFTTEIIHRFFESFSHATGFYALFDGNLQVLHPPTVKQLYDSQPKIFGGMRVSYHATTPNFNSAVVGAGMGKVRGWRDKLMRTGSTKKDKTKVVQHEYNAPIEEYNGGAQLAQISTVVVGNAGIPVPRKSFDNRKSPATGIAQGTANVRCSSRVVVKGQKGKQDVECRVGVRVRVRDTSQDRATSTADRRRSRFGGYGYRSGGESSGNESGGEAEAQTYLTTAAHAVFDAADVLTVVKPGVTNPKDKGKPKRRMSLKWKDVSSTFSKRSSTMGNVVRQPVVREVQVFTKYGRRKVAGNLMIPLGEVSRLSSGTGPAPSGAYAFEDHDIAFLRPDPLADISSVVSPAKGFHDSTVDVGFGRQMYFLCYPDDESAQPLPVSRSNSRKNNTNANNNDNGNGLGISGAQVEAGPDADEDEEHVAPVQVPALPIGQAVFRSGWSTDIYAPPSYTRRCVLYRIFPPDDDVSLHAWSGVAMIVRGRLADDPDTVMGFHSFRHKRDEGVGFDGYNGAGEEDVLGLESEQFDDGEGGFYGLRSIEKAARSNVYGAVVVPSAWTTEGSGVQVTVL